LVAGIAVYGLAYRRVEREIIERRPQLSLRSQAATQWVDYYSTADPVPNGPLRTELLGADPDSDQLTVHPQARCVHNLRSVQADHSFYFDNADEFVSRLALDLGRLTGLDLGELSQPAPLTRTRAERRWRTACRSNLRNLLLVVGTLATVAISLRLGGGRGWSGLGADLGVRPQAPYGGPLGQAARAVLDWLSKRPGLGALKGVDLQLFSGALVAAALVTVAAFPMGWLWSTWDQGAIERFFERHRTKPAPAVTRPPTWISRLWHAVLGWLAATWRRLPAIAFLVLAGLLTAGTATLAQRYAGAWWLWLAFAAAGVFTAALTLARWWTCLGRSPAGIAAGSHAASGPQPRPQDDRPTRPSLRWRALLQLAWSAASSASEAGCHVAEQLRPVRVADVAAEADQDQVGPRHHIEVLGVVAPGEPRRHECPVARTEILVPGTRLQGEDAPAPRRAGGRRGDSAGGP
jgi:hypothetical protein